MADSWCHKTRRRKESPAFSTLIVLRGEECDNFGIYKVRELRFPVLKWIFYIYCTTDYFPIYFKVALSHCFDITNIYLLSVNPFQYNRHFVKVSKCNLISVISLVQTEILSLSDYRFIFSISLVFLVFTYRWSAL